MEQDDIDQIEEALENLPKEAKDFLYLGDFEKAVTAIASEFKLSEPKKSTLDFHLTRNIALVETRDTLLELCQEWNFTADQMRQFVALTEEKIFTPLVEATNYTVEDDSPESVSLPEVQIEPKIEVPKAPSPSDILERLKEHMPAPRPITPIATTTTPAPSRDRSQPQQGGRSIDPYRELPEE